MSWLYLIQAATGAPQEVRVDELGKAIQQGRYRAEDKSKEGSGSSSLCRAVVPSSSPELPQLEQSRQSSWRETTYAHPRVWALGKLTAHGVNLETAFVLHLRSTIAQCLAVSCIIAFHPSHHVPPFQLPLLLQAPRESLLS